MLPTSGLVISPYFRGNRCHRPFRIKVGACLAQKIGIKCGANQILKPPSDQVEPRF